MKHLEIQSGKNKNPISELYTVEEAKAMLKGVPDSYTAHLSSDDFAIHSVEDPNIDMFKMLCSKFKLISTRMHTIKYVNL